MNIIKIKFTSRLLIVLLIFSTFQLIHSSDAYCQKKAKSGGSGRTNETDEFDKKQGLWRIKSGGILVAEINYLNDKKHGLATLYYAASGAMMEVANYEDGIRDGEYKRYYYNGNINTEGEYKMGKKDGTWIKYNLTNGEVKVEGA